MEIERALLASPDDDAIVQEAEKNAGIAAGESSVKRPANSPEGGDDKRQRVVYQNRFKIMIQRENAAVDDEYFRNLSAEIFYAQQNLTGDFLPTFHKSGHTQGLGWFCACDEKSLLWLKQTLDDIKSSGTITDFLVLPYAPIPPLRRVILSVPHFPRLERNGSEKMLSMLTRLNKNFDTKLWKVTRMLPPENGMRSIILGLDEASITVLENQGNKLFYGLSQVSVKIYPK